MTDNITSFPVDTPTMARLKEQRAQKRSQRFVKGPIDWQQICLAANAHPRGFELYLAIKMLSDMAASSGVRLPSSLSAELGISRETKRRALNELEKAELIDVSRVVGRAAEVTVRNLR